MEVLRAVGWTPEVSKPGWMPPTHPISADPWAKVSFGRNTFEQSRGRGSCEERREERSIIRIDVFSFSLSRKDYAMGMTIIERQDADALSAWACPGSQENR